MQFRDLHSRGFFADKNRAFWLLQSGGWGSYFLLRTLGGLANRMGLTFILPTIIVTATGFSLTLLMAAAYRRVIRMRPGVRLVIDAGHRRGRLGAVLPCSRSGPMRPFSNPAGARSGSNSSVRSLLDAAVLGAWSGLYFGINYYLLLSEQTRRMEGIAAQASSAQLEMLRYQLNPHFLFNTLNSISTLVLLKQTERANAMLSRLSSFLRYSLVGEREGLATVAQETEALKLYLEIERTRFEERLRTTFDVEPAAMAGRLPSLILQPIIENSVKYAVTPAEDGADIAVDIRVIARADGPRLVITVADTGPGVDFAALRGEAPTTISGTGVGLANIRDRLAQAYGDDHRFEIEPNDPHGLIVLIDIPFQTSAGKADDDTAGVTSDRIDLKVGALIPARESAI